MQHFAASYLGLFCLPMSHKKDARKIWVNEPAGHILIDARKLNDITVIAKIYIILDHPSYIP